MKLKDMNALFVHELKDLLHAEKQLTKALPKMAKAAESKQLRSAFEEHLQQTQGHVERLETILKDLGESTRAIKCEGMEGLLKEGDEILKQDGKTDQGVLDAALIAAAQRVEHYEIAGYGAARTFARMLGHSKAAELLQTTLDEEGAADKKLTQIAEKQVNLQAVKA